MCGNDTDGAGVPALDWPGCRACGWAAPAAPADAHCPQCGLGLDVDSESFGPVLNPDGSPTDVTIGMLQGRAVDTMGRSVLRWKERAHSEGAAWSTVDALQVASMRAERERLQDMLEAYLGQRPGVSAKAALEYAQALLRNDY